MTEDARKSEKKKKKNIHIRQASLFDRYVVQSLRENCIAIILPMANLSRAMKRSAHALWVKLKLTKRDGRPCLSLGMCVSVASTEATLSHDIPVRLVPRTDAWRVPPQLPPPSAQVLLPPLPMLRRAIERLALLQEEVDIELRMEGSLVLLVDTRVAKVCTRFKVEPVHLFGRRGGGGGGATQGETQGRSQMSLVGSLASAASSASSASASASSSSASASSSSASAALQVGRACVSNKVFLRALGCAALQPTHVACCCVDGRSLVLRAVLEDVSIDYFVPFIADPTEYEGEVI
jgi:hypothetical protein